jgi:hypothetical protein
LGAISMSRAPSASREPAVVELPTVFDQDGEEDGEQERERYQEQEAREMGGASVVRIVLCILNIFVNDICLPKLRD